MTIQSALNLKADLEPRLAALAHELDVRIGLSDPVVTEDGCGFQLLVLYRDLEKSSKKSKITWL